MGLTIHYSGKFSRNASLSEMIEEVRDIAEIYNWDYHIFETEFPKDADKYDYYEDKVYGICFTPPECETVSLCFLSNRRMSSIANLKFFGNSEDEAYKEYLYMLSTKTQFAGIDIHKLIIHLFKYLNEKYFEELKVIDEGYYWETGDEKILEQRFQEYNMLIDLVGSALENIPMKTTETFEEYFERILKIVQQKRNR
jgi:hypothetical protein